MILFAGYLPFCQGLPIWRHQASPDGTGQGQSSLAVIIDKAECSGVVFALVDSRPFNCVLGLCRARFLQAALSGQSGALHSTFVLYGNHVWSSNSSISKKGLIELMYLCTRLFSQEKPRPLLGEKEVLTIVPCFPAGKFFVT